MDYKERQKANEDKITNAFGYVPQSSGIYVLTREENGFKFAYVGQAKHLRKRLAEHLSGFQHIDLSIKSHGFYSSVNPTGYNLRVIECEESNLDLQEQFYIRLYANAGYQLRNKTAGGQGQGKFGINQPKACKTYREGIKQGEINALKEVKKYFDKYLDFVIKGDCNRLKSRKYEEFKKMLGGI